MAKAILQDIIAIKDAVIHASLELAAYKSWADISMDDIAQKSDIDKHDLTALFPEKMDIISYYSTKIYHQLSQEFEDSFSENDSIKDKLFEIIMARFDILQSHRAAVISIFNSTLLNPSESLESLPIIHRSVTKIMNLAGMKTEGLKGCAYASLISVAYAKLLRDWVKDDSPDLSATMASLDKMLSTMDVLEQKFSFF